MIFSGPLIASYIAQTKAYKKEFGKEPAEEGRWIDIEPFDESAVGPNSIDLTLSDKLLKYATDYSYYYQCHVPNLDLLKDDPTEEITIQSEGVILQPGRLYLGCTVERTEVCGLVPWIEGRSSVGRKGISVHATAGFGDDGFKGQWTLEISVIQPVRIYAGVRICQIAFAALTGPRKPYRGRYQDQRDPVPSRMHLG